MAGSSSSNSLQREFQEDLQAAFDKYRASINIRSTPAEHSQAIATLNGTIAELREQYVDPEDHSREFDYHVLRLRLECIQQIVRGINNSDQIPPQNQIPPQSQNPPQNLRRGTRRNRPPSDLPQNLRRSTRINHPPSDLPQNLRRSTRRDRPPSDLPQNLRRSTRRNRSTSAYAEVQKMKKLAKPKDVSG